jgi:hypothetical protein
MAAGQTDTQGGFSQCMQATDTLYVKTPFGLIKLPCLIQLPPPYW